MTRRAPGSGAGSGSHPTFATWLAYFRANRARTAALPPVDRGAGPLRLDPRARRALARSLQRFELGESGDGAHLLSMAERAGDPTYTAALALMVAEEARHADLHGQGVERLGAPHLDTQWSHRAFVRLRRMLGLHTELVVLLVAESVSQDYFLALATGAPDPVLRRIGDRIATDEAQHLRFQVDRLHLGLAHLPLPVRITLGTAWTLLAAGATLVVCLGHRGALRACGRSPAAHGMQAMGRFTRLARRTLGRPRPAPWGPAGAAGAA